MELGSLLATLEISEALDEHSYVPQVQSYIGKLIANIDHRFPQLHLTSSLDTLIPGMYILVILVPCWS